MNTDMLLVFLHLQCLFALLWGFFSFQKNVGQVAGRQ